ncbi:MAG: hypothetical protein DMD71_10160 [Gemmatimonadetes bacterium]|nr:MAG: hypothetical protein DMD71_10160 [Gemmatimonadota bacterium]
MRHWWLASLAAGAIAAGLAAPLQGPARRVTYRVRLLERRGADTTVLATGAVSGPTETQLRLRLRADTLEFAALLGVTPEPDSAVLAADVYSRRLVGRSRRGLPIWEEDAYRRTARLGWGDTARLYPGGPPSRRPPGLWIEVHVAATPVSGATRPTEEVEAVEEAPEFAIEAVARPRRVIVRVLLARGDAVSAPASFDLVLDAPASRVTLRRRPLERRGGDRSGQRGLRPAQQRRPAAAARRRRHPDRDVRLAGRPVTHGYRARVGLPRAVARG